jgi:hypothetical protein
VAHACITVWAPRGPHLFLWEEGRAGGGAGVYGVYSCSLRGAGCGRKGGAAKRARGVWLLLKEAAAGGGQVLAGAALPGQSEAWASSHSCLGVNPGLCTLLLCMGGVHGRSWCACLGDGLPDSCGAPCVSATGAIHTPCEVRPPVAVQGNGHIEAVRHACCCWCGQWCVPGAWQIAALGPGPDLNPLPAEQSVSRVHV